jgi:branched-chain amino acid transport system substrate-binding protein
VICVSAALIAASCGDDSKSGSSTTIASTVAPTTGGSAGAPPSTAAPASELADVNQHFTANGPLTASAPGITPTTIKIGFITSQTGIAASSFKGGDAGARARVALQNAQGGINGRQIELVAVDDGAIGPKAASQQLIEKEGVFGIVDISAFVVAAAPYMNEQKVPVVGGAFDGPEWGQAPYTNMFTFAPPSYTPMDGKYYTYDGIGKFLQSLGVTKLATLGYGISQSSTQNLKSALQAYKPLGITSCYENYSVAFGQASFTTEGLAVQRGGCNGVLSAMVDASDVGLSAALSQAGITAKAFYYTGFSQAVLDDSNARAALEGAYFPGTPNWAEPTPGLQQMLNALKKYTPESKGIPNLGVTDGYFGVDVMIRGLEAAGQNPTRESFITNLRLVDSYDGHGLFATPISFAGFGTKAMFPAETCSDYVQLKNGKFVTAAKNICGKLVETTG